MKKIWLATWCILFVLVSNAVFAGFILHDVKGTNTELTVAISHVSLGDVMVNGEKAITLKADGSRPSQDKGQPELPIMSALLMVANDKDPKVTIVNSQYTVLKLDARVAPSKGPLTRDIDPETVPFEFGQSYEHDAWIPADDQLVTVEKPFFFRDIRGTRLQVGTVQYNPKRNELRVYRSIRVRVTGDQPASGNVSKVRPTISSVFEPLYTRHFINFRQAANRLPRLNENGRLLIIALDDLAEPVLPLAAWRTKCGTPVTLLKASDIGGATTDNIKAIIKREFDKGGLTHIILVGDAPALPTLKGVKENADSDPCYVKLVGDDHVPDCMISRISATTKDEVAYQVAKFITYEQFPQTGADAAWYSKAMGIASAEGTPKDSERANWLRDALLKANRFASVDQVYDPSAPKAKVAANINEGRSLINYIGHGSKTMWVSSGFGNSDCQALKNGWKLPFIISVACVNGDFAKTGDCFAEAFMKAGNRDNPKGAVGICAASTNMEWVPPCIVQSEMTINYILNDTYITAGGIFMNGIMKGLEQYGTEPKGSGVMMVEQWHWFGDCSTLVRMRAPTAVAAKTEISQAEGKSLVTVQVNNDAGQPVGNARVCCYTEKYETVVSGCTDAAGKAVLTVPVAAGTAGYCTVTGANLVPVVDQKVTF